MTRRSAGHTALLAAASTEFAERGFDGTSIRDIAARAGVSLSALYHYYPGKQALLAAILDEGMDDYLARCQTALADVGPAPDRRLAALVAATVRYRAERSVASLILINEARPLPAEAKAAYRERQREATALFKAAVDDGVKSAVFNTPYPDDARRAVLAACNAVAQWYRPDGEISLPVLIERYVYLAYAIVGYRGAAGL